ncbi:phage tail protein [Escherichia coli]|nr:phage tail protein [Escherichia coli]MEB7076131.1 phage tail protein [Escherichia coli]HAV8631920.1 phage tail protein [Escherichia coli]HAW3389425.1 phage tail protein [Escherichia coli]
MILGFGNNVVSALAGDITTIQTDIPVMPGTGAKFAKLLSADFENKSNGQRVYAKITLTDNKESAFEICHLVSVSGDVLKVIRGQEGTTAKGWSLNDVVANFATRGSENYFVQIAQLQSGHYIAGVAGGTANTLTLELPSTFFVNEGTDWTLRTPIIVFPVQNNTNAATLQLTLGGKVLGTFPLYKGNKSELVANDIIKGIPLICLLDSEKSYFSVINPGNIYSDFDLRYVKKSGDLMTGELKIRGVNALRIFNDAFGLIFRRSEESLHLIPTQENQGENGDIGPLRPFSINLRTGEISMSHKVSVGGGSQVNGALGIGVQNALGGNSIAFGDNDTGIKQNGDGILDVYANGQHVFRFRSGEVQSLRAMKVSGTLNVSGDTMASGDMNIFGAITSTGRVTPSDYGNFDARYQTKTGGVQDVRLGGAIGIGRGGNAPSGHLLSGVDGGESVDWANARPVQVLINGVWRNVASL